MHEMFDRILSLRVSDVMAAEPITIDLSASMEDVARVFGSHGLHSAPVVDESGKCVGMITASDFVKRSKIYSTSEGENQQIDRGDEGLQLETRSYDCVSEYMAQGVQAITPEMPLIKAARMMMGAHLHVLPVIQQHRPVGIVSNLDVVAALVKAFDEAKNSI